MGELFEICRLSIFLSILTTTKASISPVDLSINSHLTPFADCTIHLIKHIISGSSGRELAPTILPVIHSRQVFSLSSEVSGFTCYTKSGKRRFQMSDSGFFQFPASPPPRQNCVVQIYIDPAPCVVWSRGKTLNSVYDWLTGKTCLSKYSLMSVIFDNTVFQGTKSYWKFSVPNLSGKHGWYLVQVKSTHRLKTKKIPASSCSDVICSVIYMDYFCTNHRRIATLPLVFTWEVNSEKVLDKQEIQSYYLDLPLALFKFWINLDGKCHNLYSQFVFSKYEHLQPSICENYGSKLLELSPFLHRFAGLSEYEMNRAELPVIVTVSIFMTFLFEDQHTSIDQHFADRPEGLELLATMFPNLTIFNNFLAGKEQMPVPTIYPRRHPYVLQNIFWPDYQLWHFLSCIKYEPPSALSFDGFLSAYDKYSWMALGITSFITVMASVLILRRRNIGDFVFQMYQILLCQDAGGFTTGRLVVGPWLLIGIILSNGYQGNNITELTKPLKSTPLNTFEEIVNNNFTIHTPIDTGVLSSFKSMLDEVGPDLLTGFEVQSQDVFEKFQLSALMITYRPGGNDYDYDVNITMLQELEQRMINLMWYPVHVLELTQVVTNYSVYIANKFANSTKAAYVDTIFNVMSMEQFIRKSTEREIGYKVHFNTKPYKIFYNTFAFDKFPIPAKQFNTKMYSIYQSGLYNIWIDRIKVRKSRKSNELHAKLDAEESAPKRIGMSDNVKTVFYVFGIFLASSTLFIIREHLQWTLSNNWAAVLSLDGRIRVMWRGVFHEFPKLWRAMPWIFCSCCIVIGLILGRILDLDTEFEEDEVVNPSRTVDSKHIIHTY